LEVLDAGIVEARMVVMGPALHTLIPR
jgi:hypothetical protein